MSSTSLPQKLGVPTDISQTLILGAPESYYLATGLQPTEQSAPAHSKSFIHCFVHSESELWALLPHLAETLSYSGMLWVSWPKKASKVSTDITEDSIRNFGFTFGLVDVKVCAIDSIWSGLKLVYRLSYRPKA